MMEWQQTTGVDRPASEKFMESAAGRKQIGPVVNGQFHLASGATRRNQYLAWIRVAGSLPSPHINGHTTDDYRRIDQT